jgi:hypothetical protein
MNNVADIYPLGPAQTSIPFHSLQAPEPEVYFEQYMCPLPGSLDVNSFRKAWQTVFDRRPALRTVFLGDGAEQPLQGVQRTVEIPFMQENWQHYSPVKHSEQLTTLLYEDRVRSFDLNKTRLMRLAIFQLDADVHPLVWGVHHSQLDGWSTAPVSKEMFDSYQALHRRAQEA